MQQTRIDTYTAYKRSDGSAVPFPVEWVDPDDAKLVWRWASDHYPLATTPLAVDLNKDAIGMTKSYAHFGGYTRIKYIHHQGYGFGPMTFLPESGDHPDFALNVAAAAPRVTELWTNTWWPLIERESRQLREADSSGLSLPQLFEGLQIAAERYEDHYELMMRASRMVRPPRTDLLAFLERHYEEDAEGLATLLLSGTSNISLEASGALWELAQQLRGRNDLLEALSTPDLLPTLPGGADFWHDFYAWLDKYGQRNSTFEEVAEPSWMEDPTVPLSIVRGHASGTADPRAEQRLAIARREELQRSLEGRLASEIEVVEFRRLIDLALPYGTVRESRPYASCISRTALRVPALALGRGLVAAGLAENPDDVFYLHLTELEQTAMAGGRAESLRPLIANRREANVFWRGVIPPYAIGAVGSGDVGPVGWSGKGVAASAGVAQGRARVILDLKDAHSFEPGEVLVTVSTSPLWTALFGLASAIVTDSGGMLSHPSIVAREHRLPAVVGARGATQRIQTGDIVLVNGTEGTVEVVSAP